MAIKKIDPNLLAPLNESNLDGTYNISEPKQIYVDASFYTSQNLSYFDKKIGLKTERCKVVKVITTTNGAGPQVGSYPWTRRNSQGLSNTNMKIIQAIVIPTNASNQSVPLLANVSNLDEEPLDKIRLKFHTKAFLEYDSKEGIIPLKEYDEVLIEYVGNDTEEARIIKVYPKDDVGVPISPPTNPQTAFNNSDGTTIADNLSNTTGDVTEPKAQKNLNQKPTGKCGGLAGFPEEDCKTEKLTATGQTITLHPKFWKTIDDLLIEIKEKETKQIGIRSAYRTGDSQYEIRKNYCPAALIEKDGYNTVGSKKVPGKVGGERWLKRARWSDVLENFQCVNRTSAAAAEGPYASNHTKGLAVDFVLEVPCAAKNVNAALYDKCLGTDPIYKLINKYASKYDIKNLVGGYAEVWHWSPNGR
jgi:hypothetical protein